jgi:uncharacterized BrkB/YihY/UPF0761 family membrane protein
MLALFPARIVVVSIYGLVMDPEEIATQVRALAVLPRVLKLPTNWSGEPREVVRMACHARGQGPTDLLMIHRE